MKDNRYLRLGVIVLFVVFNSLGLLAQQKKNFLFIMTDQQRYDALSIAGNTVLETPNLDRLAEQGAYFKNAYTPCAVCAPARSSILTGHTVENNGVRTNDRAYYYDKEVVMAMPTFDEILSENGYRCEYYGKWHSHSSHTGIYKNPKQTSKNGKSIFGHGGQNHVYMDYINEHYPKQKLKKGEIYDKFTQRPYRPDPMDIFYGKEYEDIKEEHKKASQPNFYGELLVPKEYSFTAFQAKETIEAIERLKDSVFSITCSFHFPHAPLIPPEPYYSMYPAEKMVPPLSIADDMEKLRPLQERVAKGTRVCSYNRAGYGQSEAGPLPRHSGREAEESSFLLDTCYNKVQEE
jgi:arylsulfatase A-like enzyme